jgi:hypothetical protein
MTFAELLTGATAFFGGVAGVVLIATIMRIYYDRKVYKKLHEINNNLEKILWMKIGGKKK